MPIVFAIAVISFVVRKSQSYRSKALIKPAVLWCPLYDWVMADEPSNERKGGGFLAFWTTLPGILTGLAALITAIVGAVGLWKSQSDGSSAPTTAATTSVESTTTGGGGAAVSERGRLSLASGDAADLEQAHIGTSSTTDLIFGPESTPTIHATGSSFLAPAAGGLTEAGCTRALTTRHDSFELVSQAAEHGLCVSTVEGHVAGVRIVKGPGVGSADLVLAFTVWR
jgi:hypothetical protein